MEPEGEGLSLLLLWPHSGHSIIPDFDRLRTVLPHCFFQDLLSVTEVSSGHALKRRSSESVHNCCEFSLHPLMVVLPGISGQQPASPLSLHMSPYRFYGVQNGTGWRQEDQLTLQLCKELLDLDGKVRSVIVEHHH